MESKLFKQYDAHDRRHDRLAGWATTVLMLGVLATFVELDTRYDDPTIVSQLTEPVVNVAQDLKSAVHDTAVWVADHTD